MKWKEKIRDYFTFTKNERIGLFVLIIIIIIVMIVNQTIFYFEKPSVVDVEQFEKFLSELNKTEDQELSKLSLFNFNPNKIDSSSIDTLNLPDDVKRNLMKYRESRGVFRNSQDIMKIYGMNDSIYDAILPFIIIEDEKKVQSSIQKEEIKAEKFVTENNPKKNELQIEKTEDQIINVIEINSATAEDLKALSGIGDILSERIIKYRKLLGGFYSVDQLSEVYGLSEEVLEPIKSQIKVDTATVEKLNVNFSTKDELAAHFYISWDDAQSIQDYKDKVGFIDDLGQLKVDSVIGIEVYNKIVPYLKTLN